MPTGVDRFGAVVQEQDVHDSLYSLVGDIQQEVEPLEIEVVEGLALIATVGRNLRGAQVSRAICLACLARPA